MTDSPQKTFLCITSYEKGQDFIRECKRQGAYVILLTVTALEHANWPRESIDEIYFMHDLSKTDEVIRAISFLARTRVIAIIVALDVYDVWTAANLREHLRIPGMAIQQYAISVTNSPCVSRLRKTIFQYPILSMS